MRTQKQRRSFMLVCTLAAVLGTLAAAGGRQAAPAAPISLHPANPHYFLFRGKPTVLITSGEHYGAVLNLDFDYRKYLDTLAADGLNHTRVFSGAYVEPGLVQHRAQHAGAAARTATSPLGAQQTARLSRRRQQVRPHAVGRRVLRPPEGLRRATPPTRGIVVELNLFCPMYEEALWSLSPMNAANNVNGVGHGRPQRGLHARQHRRCWPSRRR